MAGLKERLTTQIFLMVEHWMKGQRTFSTPVMSCRQKGRPAGRYFINTVFYTNRDLLIQEIVVPHSGEQEMFRVSHLKKDVRWEVVNLEKAGRHIFLKDLTNELEDLRNRMNLLQRAMNSPGGTFVSQCFDLDKRISFPDEVSVHGPVHQWFSRVSRLSLWHSPFFPATLCVVVILFFLAGDYIVKSGRAQRQINSFIADYEQKVEGQFSDIESFMSKAEYDLTQLKSSLDQEKQDFEFNRNNAHVSVLRLSEDITRYMPARKKAYRLIAANIQEAASYGEIIYEMSRLPSEEYQARILLATDKNKITPLSRYEAAFDDLLYPVALANRDADGKGFRITDAFMERREDPLGTGGSAPHYAVDIINVANIVYVDYAGKIVRDGQPPGDVVSVAPGVLAQTGFDDRYGYFAEVKHNLTPSVKAAYPYATEWSSYYAHMESDTKKETGAFLFAGETVGKIGSTGRSTGPHLHYEVRIYHPKGVYHSKFGRFDKVNPFPSMIPSEG